MLEALYQNEDILVLDKPAGLAVQPGAGIRNSLVEAVEAQFGFRPFLIHRLDRDTAGCIVVARSSRAASLYSRIMADKERCEKVYRAAAAGVPESRTGIIRDEIRTPSGPRRAETRWRLLASGRGFSLLELELGTGRMHQIRIHLAGRGHPILGDDRHGDFSLNKRLAKEYGLKRLLLYAARLSLRTDPPIRVEAPVPSHFRSFAAALGDPEFTAALGLELPPPMPGAEGGGP
ncbi:MAG: RluA family pseudouridine synthase [Treponema sp.]|nr:RluA family pseudouridine synthase [Treponema sp.]